MNTAIVDEERSEWSYGFVPEILSQHISRRIVEGHESLEPASIFMDGVCLLVDISGFTKLSGSFSAMGKGGIDELQLATNGFMGKLVEVIYSFGGDIIKFAGDAIICIFPSKIVKQLASIDGASNRHRSIIITPDAEAQSNSYTPMIEPEVMLRALDCGMQLKDIQTDKLTVHIGISCGEICFGVLGGYENRWECLISGPCIQQLSDCLDDAKSKEVVMTPKCCEILDAYLKTQFMGNDNSSSSSMKGGDTPHHTGAGSSNIETAGGEERDVLLDTLAMECIKTATPPTGRDYVVQKMNSDNVKILSMEGGGESMGHTYNRKLAASAESSTASPDQKAPEDSAELALTSRLVNHFIPVPVLNASIANRSDGRGFGFLAEMREATTMFMKWDSYDAGPGNNLYRDLVKLQPCFLEAQKILHSTGAFLRQFLVDDKGCVLIACWGVPTMSYTDNAHRALSSAAQIRVALLKLNMVCSFGITTGDVYCGTVGSPLRMEYAMIGNVVNMAARLMGKAKGGILIDDETHTRLPESALSTLESMTPIKVKGRDEPLPVHKYIAEGSLKIQGKATEDYEVRKICKAAFQELFDFMERKEDQGTQQTRNFGLGMLLGARSDKISSRRRKGLQVVLMEGKLGSGKSETIQWAKKEAAAHGFPIMDVNLAQTDALVDFALPRKLFTAFMPKEMFTNPIVQRRSLRLLMKEIYGEDMQTVVRDIALPAMKIAFGITVKNVHWTENHHTSVSRRHQLHRELSYNVSSPFDRQHSKKVDRQISGKRKHSSRKFAPEPNDEDSHNKLPSHVVSETIRTILKHLVTTRFSLVLIRNIQWADTEGFRLIEDLLPLQTHSTLVLTALLGSVAGGSNNKSTTSSVSGDSTNGGSGSPSNSNGDWLRRQRPALVAHKPTKVILLEDFSASEIEEMLSTALDTPTVPPAVLSLVQDFSGGSYFWVREILQYLQEYGAEAFLDVVGYTSIAAGASTAGGEGGTPSSTKNSSTPVAAGATLHSKAGNSTSMNDPSMATPSRNIMQRQSSKKSVPNSTSNRSGFILGSPAATPDSRMNQPLSGKKARNKLEILVVARFEKLSIEVQHVLRTASVIGMTFSRDVLYGILPSSLKSDMSLYLGVLLAQSWLYRDFADDGLFQFAHSYSHGVIYQLTPLNERKLTHGKVAQYLVDTSEGDPSQFALISEQFRLCANMDSALQYAIQAVIFSLDKESLFDIRDSIELLNASVDCCETNFDIQVMNVIRRDVLMAVREFEAQSVLRTALAAANYRTRNEKFKMSSDSRHGASFFDPSYFLCGAAAAVSPSFGTRDDDDDDAGSEEDEFADDNEEAASLTYFYDQLQDIQSLLEARTYRISNNVSSKGAANGDGNGASAGGEEAKPWQKEFLHLNAPEEDHSGGRMLTGT